MNDAEQKLLREIALDAQEAVGSWPQWKKDEYERETERFREMGNVARHGR
jgi:hypothetical protein